MKEGIIPDFNKWAEEILNVVKTDSPSHNPKTVVWVGSELYDVFTKGYILGLRNQSLKLGDKENV